MKLYNDVDTPSYLTTNPYVKRGFRKCTNLRESFRSLFSFHKDTTDIYTSILSLIVAFLLLPFLHDVKDIKTRIIFFLFFSHIIVHSPPSILTHWIGCSGYSQDLHTFFLKLDCSCIFLPSVLLTFTFSLAIFLETTALIYSTFSFLVFILLSQQMNTIFSNHHFRLYGTVIMVLFYLFPLFYSVFVDYDKTRALCLVGIVFSLLLGAVVYQYRIPECFFPKLFNYCGSHSFMHICINIALIFEFIFLLSITKT